MSWWLRFSLGFGRSTAKLSRRTNSFAKSPTLRRPVCSILGLMQLTQDEEEPAVRAQYVEMLRIGTEELERATRQIVGRVNEQPLPLPKDSSPEMVSPTVANP